MLGNENKIGSRTGVESKRRSGEEDVGEWDSKAQREGILPISMLIPFACYISYPLWCIAGEEVPIIGSMQLLPQHITAPQNRDHMCQKN